MRLNALLWIGCLFYSASVWAQQPELPVTTTIDSSASSALLSASSTQGSSTTLVTSVDDASSWSTRWTRRHPVDKVGFELGVIGLRRERPDRQVLAIDGSNGVLLNADEFRGDLQFGTKAALNVFQVSSIFGGTDLQLGYFGINSMDATRTVQGPSVQSVFFRSLPVTPSTTSNFIYSTNIYSGEAGMRLMNARRIRPIVGVRFLKVEDTYDTFDVVSGVSITSQSLTNNSLWGGQFGAEATLWRVGNFDWYANGKFGAMHNDVEGSAEAANGGGTTVVKNFSDSIYSSLVDAETGVLYSFVDGLSFKLAYQCLFLSKVANGIDQNAEVPLLLPGGDVRFNSQLWQGLNMSAEFSF